MSADFALTRNFKLSDAATTKCMLFCFGLWVKNIENIYPTSCISHISTNYPPHPARTTVPAPARGSRRRSGPAAGMWTHPKVGLDAFLVRGPGARAD